MKVCSLLLGATCLLLSACMPYPVQDTPPALGQVVDARTHRPVAGARVDLTPAVGTVTDAQGRFSFAERRRLGLLLLIPHNVPGPATVDVHCDHYRSTRVELAFDPTGEPQPLVVVLQPLR